MQGSHPVVARHRLHVTLAQVDHELLQVRQGDERRIGSARWRFRLGALKCFHAVS